MRTLYLRIRDRSVFLIFLLILLLSVGAVLLYDAKAQSEYANERMYYFEKAHEKAYSSAFLYTEQLNSLYRQMLLNREMVQWLNHPGELIKDMYTLSQIQNAFFDLITSHSGIESIYLHNKKNNMVLSTHDMLAELPRFPGRSRFEQLYESRQSFMWQAEPGQGSGLSMVTASGKTGTVAINLDRAYVSEQVMGGSPYLIWLDSQDRVLLAGDESLESFYREHAAELLDVQQSSFYFKNHFVVLSNMEARKWKLVTLIPKEEMLAGQGKAAYKYIILVLCIAMGAWMVFYFRYIRREQEKVSEIRFQRNLEDSRVGLITDLLHGKPVLPSLEEKAEAYQIRLDGEGYQVVVFQIDNYYNYLLTKTNHERFIMNKMIFNAIKWTFALKYNAYAVNSELEKVTVLLCYPEVSGSLTEELEETVRYIQDDILANCGLTVCAGISEMAHELAQVQACYAHARLAVDYKTVYGKHAMIRYEQIAAHRPSALYQANVGIDRMMAHLKAGRMEEVEACLEETLSGMMQAEQFTLDWVDAVCANMMAAIMKHVIEHQIDINHHCQEDVFITLYSYEFLEEKKAYLLKICRVIDGLMNSKHEETQTNASVKLIVNYLDTHFDQPISLTMLAGELSMSPSYLSSFIKTHLGIGFLDYVIKLRLQKAIRLLENDQLTIQKIAEACGYDTVHTFIRHFKKAHQVPPHEYRTRRKLEQLQEQI